MTFSSFLSNENLSFADYPKTVRGFHILFLALVLAAVDTSAPGVMQAADAGPTSATLAVANLPLSLDDCRRLALAHNLGLRAQRETLAAAGFLRAAELGAFEPDFVGSASQEYNQRLNTVEQTISQGTTVFQEKNKLYAAGIEGLSRLELPTTLGTPCMI